MQTNRAILKTTYQAEDATRLKKIARRYADLTAPEERVHRAKALRSARRKERLVKQRLARLQRRAT